MRVCEAERLADVVAAQGESVAVSVEEARAGSKWMGVVKSSKMSAWREEWRWI